MEDERCCGTGTCLINADGLCWCGQQWNGEVMCRPTQSLTLPAEPAVPPALAPASSPASSPALPVAQRPATTP